jgi:hypothetical protein
MRDFVTYLNDPLPAGPASVAPPDLYTWGMLGNDRYGDCTIAGAAHLIMANAAQNAEARPMFSDQLVINTYLTLTHGQDSGLVEVNVLSTWNTVGLFGEKNFGYGPLDHRNFDELRSVVASFGGAYLGIVVPSAMQQQFAEGQPLDLTGTAADTDIEGGHCVPVVGYDADYAYVVTWGKVVPATWRWLTTYLEEAWAVLTAEDARVKLAELQQALDKLTGRG